MKNTKILRAIGGVDDELIERAAPKDRTAHRRKAPWLKWAIPAAACFIIVVIALPFVFRNPASEHPQDEYAVDDSLLAATLDGIFGLPTSNHTWDEGGGMAADRMITNELRYLMRDFGGRDPDIKAAFAIVKVVSVEWFTETRRYDSSEGQIAECGVLFDVLGDGIIQPLRIKQYLYGGCTSNEETNLLRVGGVYVLPLTNWRNEDYWTIYDDLDSLFEVDDKGLIQSHSKHEQLNKYDGQELAVLWNDIEYLYLNPILHSRFAEEISWGSGIAVDGNRIALHNPDSGWYGWDAGDAGRFDAMIGADGKIVIDINAPGYNDFNIFRPVEGMTLDEAQSEVDKIKRFVGLLSGEAPEPDNPSTGTPTNGASGDRADDVVSRN